MYSFWWHGVEIGGGVDLVLVAERFTPFLGVYSMASPTAYGSSKESIVIAAGEV